LTIPNRLDATVISVAPGSGGGRVDFFKHLVASSREGLLG